MKQAFDFNPSTDKGLKVLYPDLPNEKYLITPSYIMVQLKQDDIYLTFYIRSLGQAGYVLYVHLPEFSALTRLKYNKTALLKLMSESETVALTIRNSVAEKPDPGIPAIQKIKDFTLPQGHDEDVLVLKEFVPVPFSKNAFVEGHRENSIHVSVINELFGIADSFLGAYHKIRQDYTAADWYRKPTVAMDSTIRRCLKENYLPPFIAQVANVGNREFCDELRKSKILVCAQDVATYGYGWDILPEHRNLPFTVLMMTEVLAPASKDLDLCFVIHLTPQDGRYVSSIDLGSAREMGSKLLDEVDVSRNGKISPEAFKFMPESAYIFFHANKANTGYSLKEYVSSGKRVESFSDKDERYYDFNGTNLEVTFYSYFTMDELWDNFGSISALCATGVTVIREILDYTPVYIKSFGLHVFKRLVDGMTFFFNPVRKILKWSRDDYSFKYKQ